MSIVFKLGLAGIFAASGIAAFAQPAEPEPGETSEDASENPTIIVQGYTEEQIEDSLWRSLVTTGDRIAKRITPICVGIDNLPAAETAILRSRIEANLRDLSIDMAPEGCSANAVIAFPDDAPSFVRMVDKHHGDAFEALYKPEKRRLIKPDRLHYSWKWIPTETDDPFEQVDDLGGSNKFAAGIDNISRITNFRSIGMTHSFTVIERSAIDGLTYDQLGDFLTMHLLIEFQPDDRLDVPQGSILTLFSSDRPQDLPPAMSPLDRAILEGVYSSGFNVAGSTRSRIARKATERLDEDGLMRDD